MLSFFAGSIFILFIDKYFYSLNDVQKYLRLFLYSSILLSIWGIINYFTDNFFWYKFTITPSFTGSELIEESASNLLRCLTTGQSMYLSIAVIIVLFGARHITNYFVLIIAPTLFLSLKRSSMIGCFGGIFVATLFYRPRVTSIIKFSFYCCFVIITVFCSLYFSGFFDTKYYHKFYESYLVEKYAAIINPSNDITSLWRMEIWSEAISKVQKSPWLGLGIGVQQTYSKSGFSHYEGLHNTYLDIAINTGLIGLVIFVSMIFIIIFKTSLSLNKQINYELKRIFSISLGCLAVTMITLFFNVGSIFNINLFFWSFLGIINKLGYLKNSDQVLIA
jgi:O-antigen ligase